MTKWDRSNFVPELTSEDCLCLLFISTGWFHSKMSLKWGVGEAALLLFTPKCTSTVTFGWTCSMHIPWVPSAECPVQCSNWNICLIKSLLISERGECNQMGPFWHATSILLRWHDIKGKTISIPVVQKVRTKNYLSFSVFSRVMVLYYFKFCINSSFHFVPYFLKQISKIEDRKANTGEIESSYPNKCYMTDKPWSRKHHSLSIDNMELQQPKTLSHFSFPATSN